jgi:hypothetical protein
LNFYLRLTRDLEVLDVIIGCTQERMRDYFFKTAVDGGDCLLSRGVNLRFRLLSKQPNTCHTGSSYCINKGQPDLLLYLILLVNVYMTLDSLQPSC